MENEIMTLLLHDEDYEVIEEVKPFEDEFKQKWYNRYKNGGCTLDQLQRLYNLDKLTSEDFKAITGEEPKEKVQTETLMSKMEKKISILEQNNQELKEELAQIQASIASLTSLMATTLEEK